MASDSDSDGGGFADFDSLFGESRVNHGGPGAGPVVWQLDGLPRIELEVSAQPSTGLMAHFVWQSSMTLAELLARRQLPGVVDIGPQSSVMELGSGAALPSLVCDLVLHAGRVLATDYPDEHVVEAMRRNGTRNKCSPAFCAEGLDWAEVGEVQHEGYADYVLAADTLWMPQYHAALLHAVRRLVGPETALVLAFMHHDLDGQVAAGFLGQLVKEGGMDLVHASQHNWRRDKAFQPGKEEYGDVHVHVYRRRRR